VALGAIAQVFAEKGQRLPLVVSVTMETMGTMLVGTAIDAVVAILERYPIDVLGLNCATGPDLMAEHIRYLSQHSPFAISCIPNAGLPENDAGRAVYRLTPEQLREHLKEFVEELGVQVVGGCCGTTPAHIRALAEAARSLRPKPRQAHYIPAAASLYGAQPYIQDNSFLIVGERLNASGSKKCREMLDAEDWDGLVALARSQEKEGAHILDVNVDYVGRDGERDMHELVSRLISNITIPLMLDSTEWQKMEVGLKLAGGKSILNSTNYEDGEPRFLKVVELAHRYGAGIVVGTIDEEGMARTAERKVAIAHRAFEQAHREYGIPAHEIFFDTLALPISTGIEEDRGNAAATLAAIRQIRDELPECHHMLGISNISFGLSPAARITLNSVFLDEARKAGMDGAIVNASKILPLHKIGDRQREVALDLIYDRRRFEDGICTYDPLAEFTKLFEGVTTKRETQADANLPIEERLKRHIIDGNRVGLDAALALAMEQYPPLEIINTYLLDGMKVVGELFGSGQMQLPFVLQSAETMKAAVAFLEPHMERAEGSHKGTMVIATVKGDVHDIGKNLVDIILTNNGYRVVNIGIKQPVENIIKAYEESRADCIAMSGLLVKSTAFMQENLVEFNRRGIDVPVILGGAALTPKFVYEDCARTYQGQVIYGRDAFSDLNFMDALMAAKQKQEWENRQGFLNGHQPVELRQYRGEDTAEVRASEADLELPLTVDTRRSEAVDVHIERPQPPFWGARILTAAEIPWAEVWWYLDRQALIAGQWQFRKPKEQTKEDYGAFLQEKVEPILRYWQERIAQEHLLEPAVVYGYFPVQAEGNTVFVYGDPDGAGKSLAEFTFPRQRSLRRYCIADFYAPKELGMIDVMPLQAVTAGHCATTFAQALFAANQYTDYLYFHGLAVQVAEALAEWAHARIRRELGVGDRDPDTIRDVLAQRYVGSRYSFGYPACPNIRDQYVLLDLLGADRIAMSMDESEQLYPEQSTTALVAYHPAARYFSA
jgi:5-methyltetrahydrofolate--homocysteine methyltransferase